MTSAKWTQDAVLEAFILEEPGQPDLLARYLQLHPEHAEALIDLVHELAVADAPETALLPADEESWLAGALGRLESAQRQGALSAGDWTSDILASVQEMIAMPMIVVTTLRDRKVVPSTIPATLLARIADIFDREVAALKTYLESPATLPRAAAYKSKQAPRVASDKMSFEQLLEDAGVSEADRRKLLDA